jgi:DNA gyrase subunit A
MLITNKGMLIRMPAKGISVIGRNTQGVRLITVESREEQVAGVARVAETIEAEAVGAVDGEGVPADGVEVEPDDSGDGGDGDDGGPEPGDGA